MPVIELFALEHSPLFGRDEGMRYVLLQCGLQFSDIIIPVDQWSKKKPLGSPFGQLPYVTIDGKSYGQSLAVLRYLANTYGLSPDDGFEKAEADAIVDGIQDIYTITRSVVYPLIRLKDLEKAKGAYSSFKIEHLPQILTRFDEILQANGSKFMVGNKITWADLIVAEQMERLGTIESLCEGERKSLANYSALNNHHSRILQLPAIRDYRMNREGPNHLKLETETQINSETIQNLFNPYGTITI